MLNLSSRVLNGKRRIGFWFALGLMVFLGVVALTASSTRAAAPSAISNQFRTARSAQYRSPDVPAAYVRPDDPISFQLDDGFPENTFGLGNSSGGYAALWLNRFSPPPGSFPITLDSISIYWPSPGLVGIDLTGMHPRIVVYQDTDGDGNPANATLLFAQLETISQVADFETFPVSVTVPGPSGDIYIGFEDAWAEGGITPELYPAALDQTTPHHASWVVANSTTLRPDYNNLANNNIIRLFDSTGFQGNWLIRATGSAASNPTPSPTPAPCDGTWSDQTTTPVNRGRALGVTLGSNVYLFGGRPDNATYTNTVYQYDTTADNWITLTATLPDLSTSNMGGGVLTFPEGQRIFIVGGSGANSTITSRTLAFDPASGIFTPKASWPTSIPYIPGGWAVYNNRLYVSGGVEFTTNTTSSDIWEYNPITDTWTQKSSHLAMPLGYIATELMPDNLIYLAGGSRNNGGALTDETNFQKYDPATDTITSGPALPLPRSNNQGYNVNGKFYVPMGGFASQNNTTTVQVYDPSTSSWSLGSSGLHAARNYAKGYGANGVIYALGGADASGSVFYNYTQEFNSNITGCGSPTATNTPTNTPTMTYTSTSTNTPAPSNTPTVTNTPDPCAPAWSIVSSPSLSGSRLYGVATLSANDIWAVGYYSNGVLQTLVEHWDGLSWSVVPSPNLGTEENHLVGVAAVSTNDVWTVGEYYDEGVSYFQTLIEHWDGTEWSVVPSPNPVLFDSELDSVAALSASNVWAVGASASRTLVEHWDGTEWSVVSSPNVSSYENHLYAVSAASADDIWAAGFYADGSPIDYPSQTLIEHWDGTSWSVVPSPNPDTQEMLNGVAAIAANDAWAVGVRSSAAFAGDQALIEHWDGTSWSVVPSPNPGTETALRGVAAVSPSDIWAVGDYGNSGSGHYSTLTEHWDGMSWSVVPSPNLSSFDFLPSVGTVSAINIWVAGYSGGRTLVEHYTSICSPTSTPTNTPTSTATATPSNTPTPAGTVSIVGHVTWQGPPAQPNNRQILPVTLTLCVAGTPTSYVATTDPSGFFTVTASLPTGTYNWRAKGPKYLATSGTAQLTSGTTTQVEMGIQRAGDTNSTHDNIVNTVDFTTLKGVFGQTSSVGDLNNDGVTNTSDFTLLKGNFGQAGAAVNCP